MTGREEFAREAVRLAMALVRHEHYADSNAAKLQVNVGLRTGHILTEATLVYDWANEFFTNEEKQELRAAIKAKGLVAAVTDYRNCTNHSRWYTCNGIMVVHGPVLMAALLFENEMDTRDAIELGVHQIRMAIDAHCMDGGYPEGPLYWNYNIRHMLHGVESLRRHRGIDLYREPFLHNTCDYPLHYILPWFTQCTNTADSFASTKFWPPIAALASYYKKPKWQWLARKLMTHDWGRDGEGLEYSLMFLIYYQPELPAAPPPESECVRLFSGLQQLSMRSDWSERAIHSVWLNGPSNCHHNHLHLNSFTISAFGRRLLIEMGKFDYSKTNDPRFLTDGHNSLMVDGKGQVITTDTSIYCKSLRAGMWGTVYGEFQCLREEADAHIATGHIVNAYHKRLRTFDRTMAFVRKRFFFLHDWVELEKAPPVTLDWLFHSAGTIDIQRDSYLFSNGDAHLRIKPLFQGEVSASIGTDHRALDSEREFDPYLKLTHVCQARQFEWFALIIPFETGREPVAKIEHAGDAILFEFEGATWTYDIARKSLLPSPD